MPTGECHQPIQAAAAAQGQAAAGLPCRPIEQRVMAAGEDWRWVQPLRRAGIGLGGEPAFKLLAREKPFAAKLRRGKLLRAGELIERAFGKAEEARGFL